MGFKTKRQKRNPAILDNGVPLLWGAPNEFSYDYDAGAPNDDPNDIRLQFYRGLMEGEYTESGEVVIDSSGDAQYTRMGSGAAVGMGRFIVSGRGQISTSATDVKGRVRVYYIPTNNRDISGNSTTLIMKNEIVSTESYSGFGQNVAIFGRKMVVTESGSFYTTPVKPAKAWLFNNYDEDSYGDKILLKEFSAAMDTTNLAGKLYVRTGQDRILLTAPDPVGNDNSAYLYRNDGTLIKNITRNSGLVGDWLGVNGGAIGCGRIVIGQPGTTGSGGRINIYDLNGNLIKVVTDPATQTNTYYGMSVAVGGGYIFASAPYHDGLADTWLSGSADQSVIYKYDLDGNFIEKFNGLGRGSYDGKDLVGGIPASPRFGYDGMIASGGRLFIVGRTATTQNSNMSILTLDGDNVGFKNLNEDYCSIQDASNGWVMIGKDRANLDKGEVSAYFAGEHLTPWDVMDYNKGRR